MVGGGATPPTGARGVGLQFCTVEILMRHIFGSIIKGKERPGGPAGRPKEYS